MVGLWLKNDREGYRNDVNAYRIALHAPASVEPKCILYLGFCISSHYLFLPENSVPFVLSLTATCD